MTSIDSVMASGPGWAEATSCQDRRHHRGRNQLPPRLVDWTSGTPIPADPPYWDDMFGSSLRIGLSAARNTLRPAMAVWLLMLGIVISYYAIPASHSVFGLLVTVQEKMGVWFPSIGMGLSVGILVELVKVGLSKPRRWTRENTVNALFNFAVFGLMGVTHHYRFAFQNDVFGAGNSFGELASKVAFDQFVWTVLIANPYQAICYLWKNHGFRWQPVAGQMRPFRTFWGTQMLPVLISNWAFWIPMGFLVYFFPATLQIPVSILAVTTWVMLLSVLTSMSQRDES